MNEIILLRNGPIRNYVNKLLDAHISKKGIEEAVSYGEELIGILLKVAKSEAVNKGRVTIYPEDIEKAFNDIIKASESLEATIMKLEALVRDLEDLKSNNLIAQELEG